MHKSYKIKKEKCKRFFDISIGQIEVVDKPTEKFEAIKYCKRNAGIPLPVKDQNIMNEVRNVTYECLNENNRTETRARFHSGLDCKNGIYKWFDGTEFNITNYDKKLTKLQSKKCKPILLRPLDRFYIVKENRNLSFLCLKTKKSLGSTKTNLFWDNIGVKEACIMGLSVLSIILIALFIILLWKIFHLKKKQDLTKSQQPLNSIIENARTRYNMHHGSEQNLYLESNVINIDQQHFSVPQISVRSAIYDIVGDVDDDAEDVLIDPAEGYEVYETFDKKRFPIEPETIRIVEKNYSARKIDFNKSIYERTEDKDNIKTTRYNKYRKPEDEGIYAEPGEISCGLQNYPEAKTNAKRAIYSNVEEIVDGAIDNINNKVNHYQNYNEEHFYTVPETIKIGQRNHVQKKISSSKAIYDRTEDKDNIKTTRYNKYRKPEDESIYTEPEEINCCLQNYPEAKMNAKRAIYSNVEEVVDGAIDNINNKVNHYQNYNEEHFYTVPETIYINRHHYLAMRPICGKPSSDVTDDVVDSFYYINLKSSLNKSNDDVTNETCYATIGEFGDNVIYLTADD